MSGFRVALPNPDAVDSWMVKNGLYSFANVVTAIKFAYVNGVYYIRV